MHSTSDYRSELARQEAASSLASAEAARAARKAELEAQRTALLRRVVQAEERVKAYEVAAVERARLYDAAEESGREVVKVEKRINELQNALAQAMQEKRHWSEAAASHSDAYRENRSRWNDGKGAQRELQDAKNDLDDLADQLASKSSPKSRKTDSSRVDGSRKGHAPTSGFKRSAAPEDASNASEKAKERPASARKAPPVTNQRSSPPKPAPRSAPDSIPQRRFARTVILPAASIEKKRRASEEADQAAKRARLSGKTIKVEEEDPF